MRMMKRAVFLTLCFGVSSATAAAPQLPADVAKFVDQREGCDHFRGEMPDPSERQRMKEVERELRKLCTGTDKKLADLKRKYARNRTVLDRLNEFEERIEPPPQQK